MAIALRGSASVPTGNPTTGFTVTVDAAVQANDLLFITVTSRDNLNPALGPSISDNDTGGNAWAILNQSADGKATVWWKRATSGTAGKTVTVSNCLGSAAGVLKAFSGADTGATPFSDAVQESNASGNETHAGFTPSQASSMLCAAVFNYANDNAVTSLAFATAGATTATEKTSTGGSDCGSIFGHVLQSGGPSATGNLTWAQTDGTTYSITWAIKPALVSYELVADAGGFSEAGTAAALLYHRVLAADAASFAWTGTAAGLLKGSVVAAEGGTFALAGAPVPLLYLRIFNADAGAYVWSGTAAELSKGISLIVDPGTFTVTGADAQLQRLALLAAEAGAFTVIGTAAGLSRGVSLNTEPGAFAWTGNALELLRGLVLAAESGAFILTGAALDFVLEIETAEGGTVWFRPAKARVAKAHAAAHAKVHQQVSSARVSIRRGPRARVF